MSKLTCTVVTPEETAVEEPCSFVALPLYDGELGVAINHAPMIGRLGCGELRIQTEKGPLRFYVDGGFVQVADNVISILTNRAVPVEKLKADEIEKVLQNAMMEPAHSVEAMDARDRVVEQARAQLRMVRRV
jgi:F-type H+-transporting ATPase subunit epsilon